jgi:hypothetical protein
MNPKSREPTASERPMDSAVPHVYAVKREGGEEVEGSEDDAIHSWRRDIDVPDLGAVDNGKGASWTTRMMNTEEGPGEEALKKNRRSTPSPVGWAARITLAAAIS